MSILILILKIIGILFLLILALAAVILFHPVYYCLEGEKEEELSARGYFWWIFKYVFIYLDLKKKQIRQRKQRKTYQTLQNKNFGCHPKSRFLWKRYKKRK